MGPDEMLHTRLAQGPVEMGKVHIAAKKVSLKMFEALPGNKYMQPQKAAWLE